MREIARKLYRVSILVFMLVSLVSAPPRNCAAAPFTGEAASSLEPLHDLIKQPRSERVLTEALTTKYLKMAQSQGFNAQLVGVLALAFASGAESLSLLEKLSQDEGYPEIREVASYAVLVRKNNKTSDADFLKILSKRLATSGKPLERMFIANRLAVDFPDVSTSIILDAAKKEATEEVFDPEKPENFLESAIAKTDMLYYLAQSKDDKTLKEIATWSDKLYGGWLPESMTAIMSAITPGRPNDALENSWYVLISSVRKRVNK
jgi:hypothetical protein